MKRVIPIVSLSSHWADWSSLPFFPPLARTTLRPPASRPCSTARTSRAGRAWSNCRSAPKLPKEKLEAKQKEADEKYLPHWTVQDGVIEYDGKGQSLQTVKDYGNFELYVDWKIGREGRHRHLPARQSRRCRSGSDRVGSGGLFNNQKNPKDPLNIADNPSASGTLPDQDAWTTR